MPLILELLLFVLGVIEHFFQAGEYIKDHQGKGEDGENLVEDIQEIEQCQIIIFPCFDCKHFLFSQNVLIELEDILLVDELGDE